MTYVVRAPSTNANPDLIGYPELLCNLLLTRGIKAAEEAQAFLNPSYESDLHDPFLMSGMEEAVNRILRAIEKKERVGIFSDYDADGIPGAVVLHDFFKRIGFENFENYIPHRHDEGFGLNRKGIEDLIARGATLLITIDCGVADEKEIAFAKGCGVDTIVTDHHLPPPEGVPSAFAVLNPKQNLCQYPDKNLCGSGVVYKLVQGVIKKGNFNLPAGWEKWLLDMVGIATLSDMVPLTGENRAMARYGLLVLRKSPRPGLQKLLRKVAVGQRTLTEDDVVFSITPKLNAASRMGSAEAAFRLLATSDEVEAGVLADELMHLNNERKGVVGSMLREMKKIVTQRYAQPTNVIVLGNPAWRPSLLGLAANSLMKERSCPVFIWGRDGEDAIKGSCRSDGRVNVVDLMRAAGDVFAEFGGHAASGGFTVVPDKVHVLEDALTQAYEKVKIHPEQEDLIYVDGKISADDVTFSNYRLIEQLAPFGEGNPKPIFILENVQVQRIKKFGKEGNHLELSIPRRDGSFVKAIRFFAEDMPTPQEGQRASIVASLELSSFAGKSELRLRIVDLV